MSLRSIPRALQLRGQCHITKSFFSRRQGGLTLRYYSGAPDATDATDNPTTSAHTVSTSQPVSKGQIPFTIDSHKEIKRNPDLLIHVPFFGMKMLTIVQ